jgi:hypothetical protein
MHRCKGLHCDGCRHGGAGAGAGIGALLLLLGVLLLAAHGRAIGHAADEAAHVAVLVLEMAAVVVAMCATALAGVWVARRHADRRLAARRQAMLAPPQVRVIPPQQNTTRPAVESAERPVLRLLPGGARATRRGWQR